MLSLLMSIDLQHVSFGIERQKFLAFFMCCSISFPECELSYRVRKIQGICVVLQHESSTSELSYQAREILGIFDVL